MSSRMSSRRTMLALTATAGAAVVLGPLLAILAWDWYARYFAHRTDVSYATALRWDVPSWAGLVFLWLILASLPLAPWMTMDTTPLSPHPSDPAIMYPPNTAARTGRMSAKCSRERTPQRR